MMGYDPLTYELEISYIIKKVERKELSGLEAMNKLSLIYAKQLFEIDRLIKALACKAPKLPTQGVNKEEDDYQFKIE